MVNDEAVSSGVRLQHNTSYSLLLLLLYYQGRNHGRKVEGGGQGLGPNTEALAPYARQKAGLGVGCGRGSPPPPPTVRVRGINPPLRKIFENSNANLHGDYYVMKFLAS